MLSCLLIGWIAGTLTYKDLVCSVDMEAFEKQMNRPMPMGLEEEVTIRAAKSYYYSYHHIAKPFVKELLEGVITCH